jgi:hypothetical protein
MSATTPSNNGPVTPSPRHPVTPSQKPRPPRRWVWFFLVLGVLGVAGVTTEIWSNLSQQLTLEKLAAARAHWQANGPRNYIVSYEVKREEMPDPAPPSGARYTVRVKDGRAVDSDDRPLPRGPLEYGSMDDLFDRIEQRLRADQEAGGSRPFVKATFDDQDGHVVHYVRSVMKTRERIEISVKLEPLEER